MGRGALGALRGDRMAMIFQDPMTSLNPVYTVGNQMEEIYIRHGKGDRKEARERAEYLLQKVGITAAREPARPVSASALGRLAPARDDRDDA